MIKGIIVYSKGKSNVYIEVTAKTFFALLDELMQVDYEYTGDDYKFAGASILKLCDKEN